MAMQKIRAGLKHLAVASALVVAVPWTGVAKAQAVEAQPAEPKTGDAQSDASGAEQSGAVSPDTAPVQAGSSSDPFQTGKVSYYAQRHKGHRTANGERYNPTALTMAHRTLPMGSEVRVTNLRNHRSVVVRVNDRGPYARGYIADLSLAAAKQLNMLHAGIVDAELQLAQGSPEAQTALESASISAPVTSARVAHHVTRKLARRSGHKLASHSARRFAQR
ncbi:MAG: septal ring lytic transglycosylase RlpA family protein [Leptothrix sp. (in: b-proteobacteria)]